MSSQRKTILDLVEFDSIVTDLETTGYKRLINAMDKAPNELTPSELRLMINQGIAPIEVIEQAFQLLKENPLYEGELYPGDILIGLMELPDKVWAENQSQFEILKTFVRDAIFLIETGTAEGSGEYKKLKEWHDEHLMD